MPSRHRRLTVGHVHDTVRERCFRPASPWKVGVELEWLVFPPDLDPEARVDPDLLRTALSARGALPHGSAVTFEPGGQLELSSPPQTRVADACAAAAADLAKVRAAVGGGGGAHLVGLGADPLRPPARLVRTPRYDAMEAYFDADGPAGRRMMCNTASVQVNVGLAAAADAAARQWRLAQRLGPTLVAAFANSPLLDGRPSGFRSARFATWWAIDRTRTAPVDLVPAGPDAYAAYALDARVMLVRDAAGRCTPWEGPLTLRQWLVDRRHAGWPTVDDVDYHLSTLFPPVRPRGWLELRMVDALPDPWWQVPVAVVAALLGDSEAGEAADRALAAAGAGGRWVDAARTGLAHPALADSARACFGVALAALDRVGGDRQLAEVVAAYAERYVWRGRSPADDRLDGWADDGLLLPKSGEVPSWT